MGDVRRKRQWMITTTRGWGGDVDKVQTCSTYQKGSKPPRFVSTHKTSEGGYGSTLNPYIRNVLELLTDSAVP